MATQSTYPFFENDFTKMFSEFKMPGFDIEGLMATQRRNVEAMTAASQLAVEGVQAVFRRQTEIIRQTVEESTAALKDVMTAGAPEQKIAQQTELVKATFERALGNLRELTEMAAKSNTEATDVLTKRIGESLTELKTSLQRTKN
jgi:phasin family protein